MCARLLLSTSVNIMLYRLFFIPAIHFSAILNLTLYSLHNSYQPLTLFYCSLEVQGLSIICNLSCQWILDLMLLWMNQWQTVQCKLIPQQVSPHVIFLVDLMYSLWGHFQRSMSAHFVKSWWKTQSNVWIHPKKEIDLAGHVIRKHNG